MAKQVLWRSALLVLSFATFAAPVLSAEVRGFGINRFEPSEAGSRFFGLESLDHEKGLRPTLRLAGDYSHEPQWLYATDGSHRALVEHQFAIHAGASLVVANGIRISTSIPFYISQSGSTIERFDGEYTGPDDAGLGDLRLGLDARFLGKSAAGLRMAIGFRFWAPTGSSRKYTGDGDYKLEPRIDVAGNVSFVEYAARIGFLHRGLRRSFVRTPVGDELTFGLGGGVRLLDGALFVGPELQGAWAVSDTGDIPDESRVFGALLIGARYRLDDWDFGLGAGPGLSHAAGTPKFRALASVQWTPK